MRESLVQVYENPNDGFEYGRVFKSSDFMKAQDYAHAHINGIVRDYLLAGAPSARVAGFGYVLAGGLSLTIHKGEAVDPNGLHYETFPVGDDAVVAMPAADVANPRIDLVVAVLAADQGADIQLLPHSRLLSELEIQAGVDPGDPQDFNVPTERRNTATIAVRPGVAGVAPVAPAAGANEVPLYQVRVEAGAVNLTAPKVTDVRPLARSLYNAWTQIDTINQFIGAANLNEYIDDRVNGLLVDSTYFTKVYDDAGNLLALDADLAAFDARYVNVTGDTINGQLNVTKRAATTVPAGDAALVVQNQNTANGQTNFGILGTIGGGFDATNAGVYGYAENQGGGAPATAIGVKGKGFVSHYDAAAYGGYFEGSGSNLTSGAKAVYGVYAKGLTQGDNLNGFVYGGYFVADNSSTQNNTVIAVYGKVQGAGPGTKYGGYFDGNVYVSGSLLLGASGFLFGGANLIEQRNAGNAQSHRIYNTYTDANNYERASIEAAVTYTAIKQEKLGTGVARPLYLWNESGGQIILRVGGVESVTLDSSGNFTLASGVTATFNGTINANNVGSGLRLKSDGTNANDGIVTGHASNGLYLANVNLTRGVQVKPTGETNILGGSLQMSGSTVIDSSRNITGAAITATSVNFGSTLIGSVQVGALANMSASSFCNINNANAGNINIPTAVGNAGMIIVCKGINGNEIVAPVVGGQTIDGAANYVFTAAKQAVWLISDGANWRIIAKF